MKKIFLLAITLFIFSNGFSQQESRSTISSYWKGRVVPTFTKQTKTWDSFWNMADDGQPVVYPSLYRASAYTNDTLVIKDTAGVFQKIAVSSLATGGGGSGFTPNIDTTLSNVSFGIDNQSLSVGSGNVAIGVEALLSNITGHSNTSIGSGALTANEGGNLNTSIGMNSLGLVTNGSSNVAIGNFSGYWGNHSDRFFIDDRQRIDSTAQDSMSLITGTFGISRANQKARINGKLRIHDGTQRDGDVFMSDATGVGSWKTPAIGEMLTEQIFYNYFNEVVEDTVFRLAVPAGYMPVFVRAKTGQVFTDSAGSTKFLIVFYNDFYNLNASDPIYDLGVSVSNNNAILLNRADAPYNPQYSYPSTGGYYGLKIGLERFDAIDTPITKNPLLTGWFRVWYYLMPIN